MKWSCCLFVIFILNSLAWAKLELPKNLSDADRLSALKILGGGSAIHLLGDPYPLGGYPGVEVGVSQEIIPTSDLAQLGNKPNASPDTSYVNLSFAKGLYYNLDLFLSFSPMIQSEGVTNFGGGFRWGFFEAEYAPASLSLVVGANSTSYENRINVSTQSVDLIAAFSLEETRLYAGAGRIKASGSFLGGTDGVTDTNETEEVTTNMTRFLVGFVVKFSKVFLAIEVSRTEQPNYGLKLGYRF